MILSFLARTLQLIIGHTPHFLLFIWDYFIYFNAYHILRYRIKVVRKNLHLAFPDKDDNFYKKTEKQFYHSFARMLIDIAINGVVNKKERLKHLQFENIQSIKNYLDQGQNVMIVLGHLNSWSIQIILSEILEAPVYFVYKPLSNKNIDKWVRLCPSATNTTFIDNKSTAKYLFKVSKDNIPSVFIMIADQSPAANTGIHWANFFNINTPFYRGLEVLATKFNLPVFFAEIISEKPFEYLSKYQLIYDGNEKIKDGELTQRFANVLEEAIKRHPADYLWSHKRWKKVIKY
jgi:KDO2-lipid IV(A) lauroyltransferase